MAYNIGNNLNLNNYELQNVILQKLAADPSPVEAKIYFNTVSNLIRFYDGAAWQSLSISSGTGDVVGPASSVDQQIVLFDGTTGKLLGAATISGVLKATSGVLSTAVSGTDYLAPAAIGSTVQAFDATLSALAGLNATGGIVSQTGTDTFTKRTLTGTSNRITVTNGDGVSGNPTFDIGSEVVTDSSTHSFTNKTFNANGTGNSVTNIEVADLAAGVLNTSSTLTGATDSQIPSALAVKTYADNINQGVKWKTEVRAATTVAGTLATSFENGDVIDGITLVTGDRILIKDQAAPAENGIYTVNASGAPTRATDADSGTEIKQAAVFVSEGTVNADNAFVNTTDGTIVINTTGIVFVPFSSATVPNASTTVAGKVELAIAAEAEAKSSSTLALTPASIVNFPIKKTFTIGDGATTSFALTHNLNTLDIVVSIRKVSTGEQWLTDITANSVNQVTITFGVAPTSNEFVITVIG